MICIVVVLIYIIFHFFSTGGGEIAFHCDFNLYFLDYYWSWVSFICLLDLQGFSLMNYVQILCSFFYLGIFLLIFRSSRHCSASLNRCFWCTDFFPLVSAYFRLEDMKNNIKCRNTIKKKYSKVKKWSRVLLLLEIIL